MGASFDTAIYDCTQVDIFCFGVTISKGPGASGYADGPFCEIEQDGPDFKVKKGADGTVVRSNMNEPGTKVLIHLLQSSKSNATFSAMWNLDKRGINGAGVGTMQVKDKQGTSFFESGACWVTGPPKCPYGPEAAERTWELYCTKVERFDGGN